MIVLKQDAHGSGVTTLQGRGFDSGSIDGQFGPDTTAAVKAFQAAAGLPLDGIVGDKTTTAPGLAATIGPTAGPNVTAEVTAAMVAPMFPATPHHNIALNLPIVLHALADQGLGDKAMVLMALGTIRANYTKYGALLVPPVDLANQPDQACDPVTAARLLALFLKDNEHNIRVALVAGDPREARRLVNGGSHGLADFTSAYATGEKVISDA